MGSISLDRASNNFAARGVTASGASTVTISDLGNLAISGAGGSLVVSGSGTITVDQTLNFADTLQLGAATGLTLVANVTAGGNVTMSSGGGHPADRRGPGCHRRHRILHRVRGYG